MNEATVHAIGFLEIVRKKKKKKKEVQSQMSKDECRKEDH